MRKGLLIGLLVLMGMSARAQSLEKEVRITRGTSVLTVIDRVEEVSDLRFYFKEQWVEGLVVASYTPVNSVEEVLTLLRQQGLALHRIGDKIILTGSREIITQLAIRSEESSEEAETPSEPSFLFAREYADQEGLNDEAKLFEVGARNRFVEGGSSTISGYIKEAGTADPVADVFVYTQNPFISATSDENGYYELSLENRNHTIFFQSLEMQNTTRKVVLLSDGRLDLTMKVDVIALNSLTISADRDLNVIGPQMGLSRISMEDLNIVPAVLGERDVVKVATTNAGVQFVGEGSAGVNIRGGKADQNLFLIDGAPIYNTNHFFGFFSVFNPSAVNELNLYKGGTPVEFGGRLSSVFDIRTKKIADKFSAEGGIGPVTSRLMVEAPITEKGPGVLVAGRATYSQFILDQFDNSTISNNRVSFYDFTTKVEHAIGEKDQISVTGYFSRDRFRLTSDTLFSYSDFEYSNQVFSINWNRQFNDRLFSEVKLSRSQYDYNITYDEISSQAFSVDFRARETNIAAVMDYFPDDLLSVKYGLELKTHSIEPGTRMPVGGESLISPITIDEERAREFVAFGAVEYKPDEKWLLYGGLRYSYYQALGPGTFFQYDPERPRTTDARIGETAFGSGEPVVNYHGPEWRASVRYSMAENTSIKASYNKTRQYLHLMLNAASIAPNDIWRLSNPYLKPQISDQVSMGLYHNIYKRNTFETSLEVYYKSIDNLVDFKVGTDLQFNPAIETGVLQGPGRAYGVELSIKKKGGWLTGWLNYTYSRSLIQLKGRFAEEIINRGEFFPTGYDKPHYINSVTNYKFTRRFTMTLTATYATGVPVTVPVGKYDFFGTENILYSDRNSVRVPDYLRFDVGFNIEGTHKIRKLGHSSWTFSVYNVLGRDNVYSYFSRVENGEIRNYELLVFSDPIPTITYNFKLR